VQMCSFRATAGTEVLYEGSGEDVQWHMNNVRGFSKNPFYNK